MFRDSFTEKLLQSSEDDIEASRPVLPLRKLLKRRSRLICLVLSLFCLSILAFTVLNFSSKTSHYEGLSSTLSCPSTREKRISGIIAGEHVCTEVSSNSTGFQISTCQSKNSCYSGYVFIERIDENYCKQAKAIEISKNPSYTELFHTLDGPDTFYVNFTGAEKYSIHEWTYDGNCAYKFPYQFSNAGEFFLDIIHVYKDYDGVNEVSQRWPPYLDSTLVTQHRIEICPGCLAIGSDSTYPEIVSEEIPECDRENPTSGSWLPADTNLATNISTSGYVWKPLGCRYPNRFRGVKDSKCFENPRSILFFGDSQIRVMYDNLWRRLEGYTERVPTLNRFFDMKKKIGNVVLWHHKDVFLQDFVSRDDTFLMNYDTIVFNFAHWPASGTVFGGHWTTEEYMDALNNATDFLTGVQNRRPNNRPLRLIWQGIHAFSMKNIYSKKRGDWRTISRLKNWNHLAEDLVRSKGIRAMNSFEMTYSMLDTSPDNAHYFGTDAEEAVVDEMIHKLDLCTPFP
ncbi:hypothetical protein K7432_013819 [Basidiobolus ranarum]|uniref:Trichome birefringence-like N-terminal domain-containing protein n=1 Tax=Basidiobolus ranarum TaxID=34480 RepID=A0ABR2VR76_9FUNG